jgi:Ser/Thr protein kinase RdoA (MazF antagonist)
MSFFDQVIAESAVALAAEPIDASVVAAMLRRHYGLSGDLIRMATEKDDTFRLDGGSSQHLVKVSPSSEDPEIVDLQTAVLGYLEVSAPALPVQRVARTLGGDRQVRFDDGGRHERVLRVLQFLPGLPMSELGPTAGQALLAGRMLGRVARALRGFAHPRDSRLLVWDIANFHRMPELLATVTSPVHRSLADRVWAEYGEVLVPRLSGLERQVVHADFTPFNVLVDPSAARYVTGVIDFGDTVRTGVVFDVGVGMANLLGVVPSDPWRLPIAFLTGYHSERRIDAGELALVREAALARLLLRPLVLHGRAGQDPDRHAYLVSHSRDDWSRLELALAAPAGETRALLRAAAAGVGRESAGRPN